MIEFGCLARFFNPYENEAEFATKNNFSLMQVWYDRNGIDMRADQEDPIKLIKKHSFPTIIHALLHIDEFNEHVPKLVEILSELNHKELIIHPFCKNEEITSGTMDKLSAAVGYALYTLKSAGITLYMENNSKKTPIFTTVEEIRLILDRYPELEFLLDVAHIDDYAHLEEMVRIRKPKILHVADRHLEVVHEHLPIGQGNIDFDYVFGKVLSDFDGKIIFEIVNEDQDIVRARDKIRSILCRISHL